MTGHETMDQLGFAPSVRLIIGSDGSQRPAPLTGDGNVGDLCSSVAGSADGVMPSEGEADERLPFDKKMALLNTGACLTIQRGFAAHLRETFDTETKRMFTGKLSATTMTLSGLFQMVRSRDVLVQGHSVPFTVPFRPVPFYRTVHGEQDDQKSPTVQSR
jgi:hypothetical protein